MIFLVSVHAAARLIGDLAVGGSTNPVDSRKRLAAPVRNRPHWHRLSRRHCGPGVETPGCLFGRSSPGTAGPLGSSGRGGLRRGARGTAIIAAMVIRAF